MNDFLIPSSNQMAKVKAGHLAWRSPSNIAIIKYWGKYGNQLPANPSLSMTLEQSYTETHLFYRPRKPNEELVQYFFDTKQELAFEAKIKRVLQAWKEYLPFLDAVALEFHSKNSFPHSAGIASSASSMSALALCMLSLEQILYQRYTDEQFFAKHPTWLDWHRVVLADRYFLALLFGGGQTIYQAVMMPMRSLVSAFIRFSPHYTMTSL